MALSNFSGRLWTTIRRWFPSPPVSPGAASWGGSGTDAALATSDEIRGQVTRIRQAPGLALLLDYDGTLVPFTPTPDQATPDPELLVLLGALVARPATGVHLVSGRHKERLEAWFGALPVGLHAEHGAWSREASGGEWQGHEDVQPVLSDDLLALVNRYTERTPGSLIERKSAGLAWHYRLAPPNLALSNAQAMVEEVRRRFTPGTVGVLLGEKVVEFRPAGIHKGLIVTRLLKAERPGAMFVAVGDDATDEDMFAALPPDGVSVHVGPRPSRASVRLRDVAACRQFLMDILRSSDEWT